MCCAKKIPVQCDKSALGCTPVIPFFNKTLNSYKEGFVVNRVPGVGSDLIMINDTASRLRSASYAFTFLVEHRNPMIDPSAVDCSGSLADPDDTTIAQAYSKHLLKCVEEGLHVDAYLKKHDISIEDFLRS